MEGFQWSLLGRAEAGAETPGGWAYGISETAWWASWTWVSRSGLCVGWPGIPQSGPGKRECEAAFGGYCEAGS